MKTVIENPKAFKKRLDAATYGDPITFTDPARFNYMDVFSHEGFIGAAYAVEFNGSIIATRKTFLGIMNVVNRLIERYELTERAEQ
jgi:hypothetical protein